MHPKLIKANIAMFKGVSSEARRLLDEYVAEEPDARDTPPVLWLAAQSETLHDPWINGLRQLSRRKADDPYVQMAARVLEIETRFGQPIASQTQRQIRGIALWKVGAVVAGIIAVVFVVGIVLSSRQQVAVVTPTPSIRATATPLTAPADVVVPINPEAPPADYDQGKLQITSFVSNSQRVVSLDESQVMPPIQGARFFAVNLTFECDRGICSTPPEAYLSLVLGDGSEVLARPDVKILGSQPMMPLAANARTSGWFVFDVPLLASIREIKVSPFPLGDTVQPPVSITVSIS